MFLYKHYLDMLNLLFKAQLTTFALNELCKLAIMQYEIGKKIPPETVCMHTHKQDVIKLIVFVTIR